MKENLYSNCIRTYTEKYLDVFNPDPEMICIEDIAHALSQTPRFGGHLMKFYSVAHHSCFCCENVLPEYGLDALLHDASEAYITDMPSPIKKKLPDYMNLENNLMEVISKKYGLRCPLPDEVINVDRMALQIEWNGLMIGGQYYPRYDYDPEERFLRYFEKYKNNVDNEIHTR